MRTSFPADLPVFPQLDGIFVLDKPAGPSSAHCLSIFKKLGQKKVGHAGTLDPLASGILLVLLGQATKVASHLLSGGRKIYRGMLKLGEETDTWDSQGTVVARNPWEGIETELIYAGISAWKDEREQQVPPYSAAKLNGKPLYKLARKGLSTPVKTKKIEIFEAGVLNISMPYVSFRIACSSGSYVRSLAHSLGKRLGCGAALCELVREYSHPYSLENAASLQELAARPELLTERLMSIKSALPHWEEVQLSQKEEKAVRNGSAIPVTGKAMEGSRAILMKGNEALALAALAADECGRHWKIIRGLWN